MHRKYIGIDNVKPKSVFTVNVGGGGGVERITDCVYIFYICWSPRRQCLPISLALIPC